MAAPLATRTSPYIGLGNYEPSFQNQSSLPSAPNQVPLSTAPSPSYQEVNGPQYGPLDRITTHRNRRQQYGPANQMNPLMQAVYQAAGSPGAQSPPQFSPASQYTGGSGGQPSATTAPAVPEGGMTFMGIPRQPIPYRHPSAGYNELSAMFAGNHLRNFSRAPQDLVESVDLGNEMLRENMGNYNDRIAQGNDQRLALESIRSRERMFDQMSRALLGGGAGGMGGFGQGVRDTNSGLQVGNGQVSTNINAQPLRLADILGADNAVRNTAVQHNSPVRPVSPEQQAELNQLMAGRLREIAPNVERGLIDENTPFKLAIQQGRGQQFQGLASLLNGMRGDEISRQGQNIRTLMGMAS